MITITNRIDYNNKHISKFNSLDDYIYIIINNKNINSLGLILINHISHKKKIILCKNALDKKLKQNLKINCIIIPLYIFYDKHYYNNKWEFVLFNIHNEAKLFTTTLSINIFYSYQDAKKYFYVSKHGIFFNKYI